MSRKVNEAFFEYYVQLDKLCCDKFGITEKGATEYITRLNNARFAPSRDEVLPKLVKYRNLRNSLAHDEGAMISSTDITKQDAKWVKDFVKTLDKKRDPLSLYLRKAQRHQRLRKLRRVLIISFLVIAAVAAGIIAFLALK